MAKQEIVVNSDIEAQIRLMHDVREEFYRTDLRTLALGDALAPLTASIEGLRALLPQVAADVDAYYFADAEHEGVDLEETYAEGPALLIAWLMTNVLGLLGGGDFSSYRSSLEHFGDNLSDLCSYCPSYDWEHGYFVEVAA